MNVGECIRVEVNADECRLMHTSVGKCIGL